MHTHIRCIGVPEHFNLPWHLGIENGNFEKAGVTLLWNDEPKGTGAMCAALREGSTDMAIMIAAGTVRECLRNPDIKIIGTFVDTPLTWGVHVPANSNIRSIQDVVEPNFAISRFNSGSHLLAFLYASQNKWPISENNFELVHDLNGARARFSENPDLLFLWEKFTTDFLVQRGEFRLIDEIKPPWPCFFIAARSEFVEMNADALKRTLACVRKESEALMHLQEGPTLISKLYDLPQARAEQWWDTVTWNTDGMMNKEALYTIASVLFSLGILDRQYEKTEIFEKITSQL